MEKINIDTKPLGKHLKLARVKKNLTSKELAKLIGVSVDTIWAWESGARPPALDALISIINVLEISPDYLLSSEFSPVLIAAKENDSDLYANIFKLTSSELDRVQDIMHILVKNRDKK